MADPVLWLILSALAGFLLAAILFLFVKFVIDKKIQTNLDQLKEQWLRDQIREAEEKEERRTRDFEQLAQKVLQSQGESFQRKQEEKIQHLLQPLGQKLSDFHQSLSELRTQGIQHHTDFKAQLEHMRIMNTQMNEEARNLTRALQDQKEQGVWGEMVLERVLESSGLQEGREYRTQSSHSTDEGRKRPDVIVLLPNQKNLIIDAKVSLSAYLRLTKADAEEEREKASKEHLKSIRTHIDGLSKKAYDDIEGITSPEFVLLFIPVEPAFSVAIRTDDTLFEYAFDRKIILVTPTTLLATLRTVASTWRQEKQTKNALEIARLGGELYNKFASFTEDLQEVGTRLDQARSAQESALRKLSSGKGNVMRTIERMKELGIKTKKDMPLESESGDVGVEGTGKSL